MREKAVFTIGPEGVRVKSETRLVQIVETLDQRVEFDSSER